MEGIAYLTVHEALFIHGVLLKKHGGLIGVRESGLVEAAINRPLTGYYQDIVEEAAALFESLAINHCFADGNKRVAFGVMDVFLRCNGYRIDDTSQGIYSEMIRLFDSNQFNFVNLEKYLRKVVRIA